MRVVEKFVPGGYGALEDPFENDNKFVKRQRALEGPGGAFENLTKIKKTVKKQRALNTWV